MKQKVLVTGATGFVGNHVVNRLLGEGFEVVASSAGAEKAALAGWYNQVTYVPFDLNDFDSDTNYYKFFGAPDLMIHLSWEGLPNYKAAFHVEKNLPVQLAFLQNMLRNGLANLTVTGTCFEYGAIEGCLEETMEVHPDNPYGIAKNLLRLQLEEYCKAHPFSLKWLRLFYMYGEGQSAKSLISQLDRALKNGDEVFNMSGGEQVRDFLPVHEVARYIVAAANQLAVEGVINCCSGNPVTVKAFVEQYLAAVGKTIALNLGYYPYADYEPMRFWGSNKKLKSIKSIQ